MNTNIIITSPERQNVANESPSFAADLHRVLTGSVPSPIRFSFGTSNGAPVRHVIEYERLAQYGKQQGERLYATRQSSLSTATSTWHPPPHSSFTTFVMADPKKQEKDFTKEVDALLPEVQAEAKVRVPSGLVSLWH